MVYTLLICNLEKDTRTALNNLNYTNSRKILSILCNLELVQIPKINYHKVIEFSVTMEDLPVLIVYCINNKI